MSFIFTGASKLYFRNKIIRAKKLNSQPDNYCGVVMIIVMDRRSLEGDEWGGRERGDVKVAVLSRLNFT